MLAKKPGASVLPTGEHSLCPRRRGAPTRPPRRAGHAPLPNLRSGSEEGGFGQGAPSGRAGGSPGSPLQPGPVLQINWSVTPQNPVQRVQRAVKPARFGRVPPGVSGLFLAHMTSDSSGVVRVSFVVPFPWIR